VRQICDVQGHRGPSELLQCQEVEGPPPPPSWNVAPTQDVPIIAERLDALTPRIVSPRVNSVRNNGPELIEPAPE
jgi:putative SOS response-associated peptidase YedK